MDADSSPFSQFGDLSLDLSFVLSRWEFFELRISPPNSALILHLVAVFVCELGSIYASEC